MSAVEMIQPTDQVDLPRLTLCVSVQGEQVELTEEWGTLPGYDYFISSFGRVYNAQKGAFVKPYKNGDEYGYLRVALYQKRPPFKDGKKRKSKRVFFYLHRIVALVHVAGRTRWKNKVHHRDADPANCAAYNLEWCSQWRNMQYRWNNPLPPREDLPLTIEESAAYENVYAEIATDAGEAPF